MARRENLYSPLFALVPQMEEGKGRGVVKEQAVVGEPLYHPKPCEKVFRVIFIRSPRTGEREICDDWHWTYQAYITESSSELSAEDAVELYR